MTEPTSVSTITDSRGVTRLTLSRPKSHNAFDDALIAELSTTLTNLEAHGDTRILILQSDGKHFSAGADLNWMKKTAAYQEAENQRDAKLLAQMLNQLNEFPAPTIARVQGAAMGGGVGLIACCDIAIAADNARFALSEVRLGLIPATISPFVLAAIGNRAARRYFLTAERFDATTAQRLGLIHEVIEDQQLDASIAEMVAALLANGPAALRSTKALIRDVSYQAVDDVLMTETAKRIAAARASDEGREGVQAFLEKRKPDWIDSDV